MCKGEYPGEKDENRFVFLSALLPEVELVTTLNSRLNRFDRYVAMNRSSKAYAKKKKKEKSELKKEKATSARVFSPLSIFENDSGNCGSNRSAVSK